MGPGTHSIEVAAAVEVAGRREVSERSAPLYVLVAPTTRTYVQVMGTSPVIFSGKDGVRFAVEVLASGLNEPCALAVASDGRVFVAERTGRVRVWQSGRLLPDPALFVNDVALGNDVGLIGMTLHPDFSVNHQVYLAYTGRSRTGELVNRVVRVHETNNSFRGPILILEDAVTEMPRRTPRIRFGPDRKLYVAFATGSNAGIAEDLASYSGKILRLNDDGTTPKDNRPYSPIIRAGYPTPGAFDWQPVTGRLWVSEQKQMDSPVDAVSAAFYANGTIARFRNQLFIAGLTDESIRRVTFDSADPGRVADTESFFEHEYGQITDLVVGPDGAIYFSGVVPTAAPGDDRLMRVR